MNLICFGDSICYGYGASPGTSWVARLQTLAKGLPHPVNVLNAGVNGDTTTDGLRRMTKDVESKKPDAVYIQFGLNDCSFWCRQPGHPWTECKTFIANIEEMLRRSFQAGARAVFLATNHPVAPDPMDCGTDEYQRNVISYNEALRRTFSKMRGVMLLDLEKIILAECPNPERLLLSDGVHLSPAGNELYFKVNSNQILRNLPK